MSQFALQNRLNHNVFLDYDAMQGGAVGGVTATSHLRLTQEGRDDMDVRGIGSVSATPSVRSVGGSPAARDVKASPVSAPRDELSISSAGKMLDQLSQNSDVRAERIAQIKEAIANGTYDTDEKLEAALSRMFDALGVAADDE